jgi:glycosyltransferase involved in cell wall biosynthesis
MKYYLLIAADFVTTGGMDRANFALADYLARQGEEVHLVAYRVAPQLLAQPNVTFHQVPKVANSYFLSEPLLDWVGRFQARRITQAGGRVLVNGGNCQWAGINWVHYVHAAYRAGNRAGLLRRFKGAVSHQIFLTAERRALLSAQIIIANSHRTKQDLIERLSISPQQIHLVYYGIDPQFFYPATPQEKTELRHRLGWQLEKPIVMFIGALGDRRKGFDTLFSAWQQLCADPNWDANLVTVGVGAELPLWQKRAEAAGISSRIHFLGFRSDVPNLLRAADCLVAPTRYEAYGLGVHEALCCGLPALVSATAGVAERYPSHLSELLLPNPDDPADLATRLRQWRGATAHYSRLISSLSHELRNYTWDKMAATILEKMEGSNR